MTAAANPPPTRGVVYVATSPRCLAEAAESCRRLRRSNPGLPVCLVTADPAAEGPLWNRLLRIDSPLGTSGDKLHMLHSPWDWNVFLDSDTSVNSPLDPVFELLQRFDFAAVQISSGYHYRLPGVPDTFPEFNSGVIAFRKSPRLGAFFQRWRELYLLDHANATERVWDQKSLRQALFESSLHITSLPPEYNFMPYLPGFAMTPIHIAHGRDFAQLDRMKTRLDRRAGPRVWIPGLGVLRGASDSNPREIWSAALRGTLHCLQWLLRRRVS